MMKDQNQDRGKGCSTGAANTTTGANAQNTSSSGAKKTGSCSTGCRPQK